MILFVLGFSSRGFTWVHGALFAAMIASTDALAATAILKQGEAALREGAYAARGSQAVGTCLLQIPGLKSAPCAAPHSECVPAHSP